MTPSADDTHRVALVTGGSRGIGRAIVQSLAGSGWRVYFCSRNRDSLSVALDELRASCSERVTGWLCDVSVEDQVDELIGRVVNETGRIDCLVNNAGIGLFSPIDEISGDDWRRVIDTNLSAAFYGTRSVAPTMKRQGFGWILNIVSLAGKHAFARGAAYNASKAGLLALSEAAMLDLRPHGIRVAAILPGSVNTEFSPSKPGTDDSWKLTADDVARTVTNLLSYPDRALPSLIELRPSRPPSN